MLLNTTERVLTENIPTKDIIISNSTANKTVTHRHREIGVIHFSQHQPDVPKK